MTTTDVTSAELITKRTTAIPQYDHIAFDHTTMCLIAFDHTTT